MGMYGFDPSDLPTTPKRVQKLKAQADLLDRKADHIKAMMGNSTMFKHTDVWKLREQAKKLRADAVALILVDAR